jgi:hypothetical protein
MHRKDEVLLTPLIKSHNMTSAGMAQNAMSFQSPAKPLTAVLTEKRSVQVWEMLACHGQRGEIPNSKMETLNNKYLKR